jgi:SNF2 family DNA or RNA helicase
VTSLGSVALNLGKYGLVMHLDLPWTPKDVEQSEGRVDRPNEKTGKSVPTTAYRIIVADSYEQRLERKLDARHADFKSVFTHHDLEDLFGD